MRLPDNNHITKMEWQQDIVPDPVKNTSGLPWKLLSVLSWLELSKETQILCPICQGEYVSVMKKLNTPMWTISWDARRLQLTHGWICQRKKVYSTLLVQYPNTLATRARFHYSSWDHWRKKSLLCAECMDYSVKSEKFQWLSIIFLTCQNIRCAKDRVPGILPHYVTSVSFFYLGRQWKKRWRIVKQLRTSDVIFMELVVGFHPQTQAVSWRK